VEYRNGTVATYSRDTSALVELGFPRTCSNLAVEGIAIFAPPKQDRLKDLWSIDKAAYEDVGMIVFKSLGISVSGFTHADDSDVAISVFAKGRWDVDFDEMKPFNGKYLEVKT
jgi:hypothetical protein